MTPDEFAFEIVQLDRLFRARDTAGDRGTRAAGQHLIECKLAELKTRGVLRWFAVLRRQDVAGWKMQDALGTPQWRERSDELQKLMVAASKAIPADVLEAVNRARAVEERRQREQASAAATRRAN